MAVRGKTLTELDRLIAEYHELIRARALLRRGPKMNRLQQVLTEIREHANFLAREPFRRQDVARQEAPRRGPCAAQRGPS